MTERKKLGFDFVRTPSGGNVVIDNNGEWDSIFFLLVKLKCACQLIDVMQDCLHNQSLVNETLISKVSFLEENAEMAFNNIHNMIKKIYQHGQTNNDFNTTLQHLRKDLSDLKKSIHRDGVKIALNIARDELKEFGGNYLYTTDNVKERIRMVHISLNETDFDNLIRGKVVEKGEVKIALQDIGYVMLIELLNAAYSDFLSSQADKNENN